MTLVPEHDGGFLDWYLGVQNGKFWGITSFSFHELRLILRALEEAREVEGTKMAGAVAMADGIGTCHTEINQFQLT